MDSNMLEGYTNMDLVKDFIENLHHPEVLSVIKRDDKLIKKETEEIRREEDEIWSNMMKDLNKQKNSFLIPLHC